MHNSNTIFPSQMQYQVDMLKFICESALCDTVCADSAVDLLALSDFYNADMLRETCADFIRSNKSQFGFPSKLKELENLHLLKHLEEPAKHLIILETVIIRND